MYLSVPLPTGGKVGVSCDYHVNWGRVNLCTSVYPSLLAAITAPSRWVCHVICHMIVV